LPAPEPEPEPEPEPGNRIEIGPRSRELLTVFYSPPDRMDPVWHLGYCRDSDIQGRKWADILILVVGIAYSECTSGAPWGDILDAIEDECRRVRAACLAFERGDPDEPFDAPPLDITSEDEEFIRDLRSVQEEGIQIRRTQSVVLAVVADEQAAREWCLNRGPGVYWLDGPGVHREIVIPDDDGQLSVEPEPLPFAEEPEGQ